VPAALQQAHSILVCRPTLVCCHVQMLAVHCTSIRCVLETICMCSRCMRGINGVLEESTSAGGACWLDKSAHDRMLSIPTDVHSRSSFGCFISLGVQRSFGACMRACICSLLMKSIASRLRSTADTLERLTAATSMSLYYRTPICTTLKKL
jgi:hypothetical protein